MRRVIAGGFGDDGSCDGRRHSETAESVHGVFFAGDGGDESGDGDTADGGSREIFSESDTGKVEVKFVWDTDVQGFGFSVCMLSFVVHGEPETRKSFGLKGKMDGRIL